MKYTIEFEVEQLKQAIAGLQELPYKVSSPVINMILEQAGKQELEVAKTKESKQTKESKKE